MACAPGTPANSAPAAPAAAGWHTSGGRTAARHHARQATHAARRAGRAPGTLVDSTNGFPAAASGCRATHRRRTAASGAPAANRRCARLPSGKRTASTHAPGAPAAGSSGSAASASAAASSALCHGEEALPQGIALGCARGAAVWGVCGWLCCRAHLGPRRGRSRAVAPGSSRRALPQTATRALSSTAAAAGSRGQQAWPKPHALSALSFPSPSGSVAPDCTAQKPHAPALYTAWDLRTKAGRLTFPSCASGAGASCAPAPASPPRPPGPAPLSPPSQLHPGAAAAGGPAPAPGGAALA